LSIQRAVPLALGILSVSNPDLGIMDILSKLSHNHDSDVAMGAIFGLGLIGAGTNNARVGQLLRGLASYYHKEPSFIFIIRVAQGLLYLGKGTITLNPYHSGKLLLKQSSLAALLVVCHTCLDFKELLLKEAHYFLFTLSLAMTPRNLMTFDEDMKMIPVQVRVGKAVDIVGKPGNPKTITGFQTHSTPVLLAKGDRAELATDDYIPYTTILEGSVLLKPNPDSTANKKKAARLRRSRRKLLRSSQKQQ